LVNHSKLGFTITAAAGGSLTDAGDVHHISVILHLQPRRVHEVVEVADKLLALRKHLFRVGAKACRSLHVVDVSDERVPVVTEIEFDVRLACVTLVDADQLIMTRVLLEEAPCACPHIDNYSQK